MSFSISLKCRPTSHSAGTSLEHQDASVEYENLVMEACDVLADTDCDFHVAGFGSSEWALDVSYDLSAFMEQFPELLAGVRSRRYVEVDLYSQGVERVIQFHPEGDMVKIRCESRTNWTPDPDVEFTTQRNLDRMLSRLAVDFASALRDSGSPIARVAPFVDWQSGRV
ncbi:hypothetical protein [Streptomyces noursei]|uniref:hypothetical protein n=1 Tax=Streptomyces noursei TaxID=1971 RepID=UPI0035DE4CA6